MNKVVKVVKCRMCDLETVLLLYPDDIKEWREGAHTQDTFNYLSAGERELLISGICETCFDSMFKED